MINGMLNVYKEKGFTSHDVVAKLRGILRQKKIGHTGTLDPDAVGVLPICLGKGTKLCDMLTEKDKTYVAVMRLGIVTDTQDMTGTVLKEAEVTCDETAVKEALLSFVGQYEQVPPMYSALKVNGKKLYELAREGIEVERKARTVWIHDIAIKEMKLPFVTFEVSCSKGTYIRTLCQDVGEKLGCGACMQELTRTRVSAFSIEDALKLDEIQALSDAGQLDSHIVAVDSVFGDLEAVYVKAAFTKLLHNGNPVAKACCQNTVNSDRIRVYDADKNFVGIYYWKERANMYFPEKIFLDL